ncbi:MAG: FkbM family methyltransferase [Nanoarchaeota archaeon]|nr:FkbM family methyltransferase [Nanoarchaeota archaeon]
MYFGNLEIPTKLSKLTRSKYDPRIILNLFIYRYSLLFSSFLKKRWGPQDKVVEVKHPFLRRMFKFKVSGKDKGFSFEFYITRGLREPLFQFMFTKMLNKKDILFDIGANLGIYSVLASFKCKKVYGVEPNPLAFSYLCNNLKINKIKNVLAFPVALGSKDGVAKFLVDVNWNWSQVLHKNTHRHNNVISVQMCTPLSLIVEKALAFPNVVRMDVEGYEYIILNQMHKDDMLKHVDKLFIELHPTVLGRRKTIRIIKLIEDNGLELKYIISEVEPEYFLLNDWLKKIKLRAGRYGIYEAKELVNMEDKTMFFLLTKGKEIIFERPRQR